MSFGNDKYSVDKDPDEWCLRQSKRLKSIDPEMNTQVRNHKILTQIPRELEHAVKCRFNQSFTQDDIANTLQDVRKIKNMGKYSQYRSSSLKEKEHFREDFKDKLKERVAEVTKNKTSCHDFGQQTTMLITVQRQIKNSMPLKSPSGRIPNRGFQIRLYG
ncbi:hypothetical protein O181_006241 [Austropuccinia psidii MF-1]|uniref:Uncharacterized protein n=1 Tax=Austropuccinia psidii MF-1 TaxID=1389203 RepID=A0A9Q3GGL0_9BASI|nr:hypothetical protein [Austropuccinia psidii MF-1]